MKTRYMISFDWAMKRLLCSNANLEILEGFLRMLLRHDINFSIFNIQYSIINFQCPNTLTPKMI